jgi:type I restriction enzyme S subunit
MNALAGWRDKKLSEIAMEIRSPVVPTVGEQYELWSVPSYATGKPEILDGAEIGSTKLRVQPWDVLVCKINPRINRVWVVEESSLGLPQIASPEWLVLRFPAEGRPIIASFIANYLSGPEFRYWITGAVSGVTGSHTRAKAKEILQQTVPLPPMVEQQQIVADLKGYLARVEGGLSSLRRVGTLLSSWRGAMLARAFRGDLVEDDLTEGDAADLCGTFALESSEAPWVLPDRWAWRRLGDLFTVSVGATPSRSDASLWGGGIPWVSSGEVAFNRIYQTRETISAAALPNPGSRIHPPGTVMIAMIGEGKTRGQAAILDIAAAHNQNCASIRVSETSVLPEYIYWFLRLRYNENRQVASGGNQPALNKGKVENILVPLAPLGTQKRIVSALEINELQIARTMGTTQEAAERALYLKEKIYRAAFGGRLHLNRSQS